MDNDGGTGDPALSSGNDFSWKRNLYILWGAQLIAMIGMSACVPFLPLYIRELGVRELTETTRWSGLIQAGPFFLSFITTPIWGALGDKYGKKPMVIRAIFGLAVTVGLMAFAQDVWQLFFLRIIQGAVSGFIASSLALVSATTPTARVGYAIGFLETSISVGTMIGPLFGGVLADMFGLRSVFIVVAALCFISGSIIILFVRENKRTERSTRPPRVRENIRYVLDRPELRRIIIFIVLVQASVVFVNPIFILYLESLNTPASLLKTLTGLLIGSVGLFTALFAPFWGRRNDKQGYVKTLSLALPIRGMASLLQGFVPSYIFLFPLRIVIGVFTAALIPTLYTALSKRSPQEARGGLMGLASSGTLLGNLLAPIACGWLAAHTSMEWCFVASGLLSFGVFAVLRFRPLPADTPPEDTATAGG